MRGEKALSGGEALFFFFILHLIHWSSINLPHPKIYFLHLQIFSVVARMQHPADSPQARVLAGFTLLMQKDIRSYL
jgi:hypothetical protein